MKKMGTDGALLKFSWGRGTKEANCGGVLIFRARLDTENVSDGRFYQNELEGFGHKISEFVCCEERISVVELGGCSCMRTPAR